MAKMPIVPVPEFSVYRNFPSALTAMSRFVLPAGFVPTTVAPTGVNAPVLPTANPEIVDEPAFETYTKRPSGVTTFQQFALPRVGTPRLMALSVPSDAIAYDEIVEALFPPAGPVSETRAAPFGANVTANVPGAASWLTTIGDSVPSACTRKTSRLFVARSVTTRNWPSGLKARDAASELLVVRKRVEFAIRVRCPLPKRNPTTLLLPPTLST